MPKKKKSRATSSTDTTDSITEANIEEEDTSTATTTTSSTPSETGESIPVNTVVDTPPPLVEPIIPQKEPEVHESPQTTVNPLVQELETRNRELQTDLEHERELTRSKQLEIERIRNEIENEKKATLEAKGNLEKLTLNQEILEKKPIYQQQEINSLKQAIQEEQIHSNTKLNLLQTEKDQLLKISQGLQQQISQVKQENEQLMIYKQTTLESIGQIPILQAQIISLQNEKQEISNGKQELLNEKQNLNKTIVKHQEMYTQLQNESTIKFEKSQQLVDTLQKEVTQLRANSNNKDNDSADRIQGLEEENKRLLRQVEQLQAQLNETTNDNSTENTSLIAKENNKQEKESSTCCNLM